MVKLFPREVPRVLNLFPREEIEGTPKDFPEANAKPHLRPDPRPKTRGAAGPEGFWPRVWPIENSRNFPREQFHHTAPEAFQHIVILTKSLQ